MKTVAAAFSMEGVLFDHHPIKGIAPKMRCLMDGQELPAALLKFLLRMISNLASDLEERRVGSVWREMQDDLKIYCYSFSPFYQFRGWFLIPPCPLKDGAKQN